MLSIDKSNGKRPNRHSINKIISQGFSKALVKTIGG
jgi:hypothetical protein